MVARILSVLSQEDGTQVVSYRLYDTDGFVLEEIEHAGLDDGWWHAFQPLQRRYG